MLALILSYEQIYKNPFNKNKVSLDSLSKKGGLAADTVKEIIYLGLRSVNSPQIIEALLELLYFLCEQKEIFEKIDLQIVSLVVVQCLIEIIPSNDNIVKSMVF